MIYFILDLVFYGAFLAVIVAMSKNEISPSTRRLWLYVLISAVILQVLGLAFKGYTTFYSQDTSKKIVEKVEVKHFDTNQMTLIEKNANAVKLFEEKIHKMDSKLKNLDISKQLESLVIEVESLQLELGTLKSNLQSQQASKEVEALRLKIERIERSYQESETLNELKL